MTPSIELSQVPLQSFWATKSICKSWDSGNYQLHRNVKTQRWHNNYTPDIINNLLQHRTTFPITDIALSRFECVTIASYNKSVANKNYLNLSHALLQTMKVSQGLSWIWCKASNHIQKNKKRVANTLLKYNSRHWHGIHSFTGQAWTNVTMYCWYHNWPMPLESGNHWSRQCYSSDLHILLDPMLNGWPDT